MTNTFRTLTLSLCVSALLMACGGGSGGDATNASATSSGESTTTTATPNVAADPAPPAAATPDEPVVTGTPSTTPEPEPPVQVPVAVVPNALQALTKKSVSLDGSKSPGVGTLALSYAWSLESKPDASTTTLNPTTYSTVVLWPDVAGTYKLKLVVSSGGKTSEPAYVDVDVVAPGALPPFATFNVSGLSTYDGSGSVGGCNFLRSSANFQNFWDFRSAIGEMNCSLSPVGAPADLQAGFTFSGGTLSYMAANLVNIDKGGISGTSMPVWKDATTLSGYGYGVSAEGIELNKLPAGKATGTAFVHRQEVKYVQPWTTGTMPYTVEGTFVNTNVPAGWELAQTMTVRVTLEGDTFVNGQPGGTSVPVFEQTYSSDFSETLSLNLNWATLPATFSTYAVYRTTVEHRMAFKRIAD